MKLTGKIRSAIGLWGVGSCTYTCNLEKDILYPGEPIKLHVKIDNSACKKKIGHYRVKLLRRTQVFDTDSKKPIYTNDCIVVSEKIDAVCEAKGFEEKSVVFDIPQSIFVTKEEEERIKVPL